MTLLATPRQRCEAVRRQATAGLSNLQDYRGVGVLIKFLTDPDSRTRSAFSGPEGFSLEEHALQALYILDSRLALQLQQQLGLANEMWPLGPEAGSKPAESIPQLLARLVPGSDREDSWAAAGQLVEIELATGGVVSQLVSAYAAGEIDLQALSRILRDKEILRRLLSPVLDALGNPAPEVRSRLVDLLAVLAYGYPATVAHAEAAARLRDLLGDPEIHVRERAARALKSLQRPLAPETSARLAHEQDPLLKQGLQDRIRAVRSFFEERLQGIVTELDEYFNDHPTPWSMVAIYAVIMLEAMVFLSVLPRLVGFFADLFGKRSPSLSLMVCRRVTAMIVASLVVTGILAVFAFLGYSSYRASSLAYSDTSPEVRAVGLTLLLYQEYIPAMGVAVIFNLLGLVAWLYAYTYCRHSSRGDAV